MVQHAPSAPWVFWSEGLFLYTYRVRPGRVRFGRVRQGMVWLFFTLQNIVRSGMVGSGRVRCGLVWYGYFSHSEYCRVGCGRVRFGRARRGVAWYGTVWFLLGGILLPHLF